MLDHEPFDTEIQHLFKKFSINLLPTLDPDGLAQLPLTSDNEGGNCKAEVGRLNANGVDLELDFQAGGAAQPETQSMMEWMKNRPFVMSIYLTGSSDRGESIMLPNLDKNISS